jgi:hypothetical protein
MKIADPDLGLGLCEGGHPDRRYAKGRHAKGRARCCNEFASIHDQPSLRVTVIVASQTPDHLACRHRRDRNLNVGQTISRT